MSKNFTFNNAPAIQMRRSRISGLSYGVNTSLSMGRAYPCYVEEILPGDTFKVNTNMVARLTSQFIKPVYGNLFADVFYFFVPWRLVYDDFPVIFGENKEGYWKNSVEAYAPMLPAGAEVKSKTLSDYLELPVGKLNTPINTLYHRAVALVWNEWFRDENYQEPVFIQKGSDTSEEELNDNEWSPANYTGKCPPISKYKDYFTSVLPEPQKGDAVELNLISQSLPVVTKAQTYNIAGTQPLSWQTVDGVNLTNGKVYGLNLYSTSGTGGTNKGTTTIDITQAGNGDISTRMAPNNLYVDLNAVTLGTVNDLRLAFQTQKILERDALGTRYVEHILNTFGVTNPDSRLHRPELLNATRFPLNIQQVASTGGEESLAKLGAYSLTSGKSGFSKAFSEYGCVIGFVAVRQFHSYQQGLPRRYTRRKRLDWYNPALAYVGMMPVHTSEIYAEAPEEDIFGYQRAWSEYRHHQNVISGQMRSNVDNSLDVWNIGDEYGSKPVASPAFITETPNFLNRVITVEDQVQDQFIFDIWHDVDAIRVMPANPMPGLIDHY